MLFCQILKTFREMEDSLHLKTEPILIFVNDFLNVMARFGITSDEELFLLLCYYSQTHRSVYQMVDRRKRGTDDNANRRKSCK